MNDILAQKLGLEESVPFLPHDPSGVSTPIPPGVGIGRIGQLKAPRALKELGVRIKEQLSIPQVRLVGNPDSMVQRIALSTGSGGSLVHPFIVSEAEVFITGDIKYHQAREVELSGKGIIDIGHFASEHLFIDPLIQRLQEVIPPGEKQPNIEACPVEKDPFFIQ
jgi:putative NIF3 family GTP cyclohydrolase 1 type 2